MPDGSFGKESHDCTILVKDGAALTYNPSLFDGAVSIGNLNRKQREIAARQIRGSLKGLRHKDRIWPTFTLKIDAPNFAGGVTVASATETATPAEVFNRLGTWAAATSTLPQNMGGNDVFTVDVDINVAGTAFGDTSDHKLTAKYVVGSVNWESSDDNMWTIECTCYGGITGDLSLLEG